MKKSLIFGAAALVMAVVASCGGEKKGEKEVADNAAFEAEQPMVSGEYRAVSFQYDEPDGKKVPFDGRLLVSLDPKNSAVYVYENGNHTHFKALEVLSKPFAKTDSTYTAANGKDKPVIVKRGAEVDTLIIVKGDKTVKVAFERAPMSEMSAIDAMTRISTVSSK